MPPTASTSIPPEGFLYLPGRLDGPAQAALLAAIEKIVAAAPLYTPTMPRTGKPMSVRMTNCGTRGWVTDKARGYRYQATHPETNRPWPAIPEALVDLWREVAGYPALPEACLVNHYTTDSKLGLHQDADEDDAVAPVVSVSLGDEGVFRIGGLARTDPTRSLTLRSGDVVVLGGAARMAFHGVDRIRAGSSRLLTGTVFAAGRVNLTLRRVTRPGS